MRAGAASTASEAPQQARGALIETRLGAVHVRSVGSGPPAVLWHSMFTDGASWDPVLGRLARHRTLHIVDGPGFGLSSPLRRRTSIAECALAAGELLDALSPDRPVSWVGNGWGGHVGLELAARSPERLDSLATVGSPTTASPRRLSVRVLAIALGRFGAVGPLMRQALSLQLTRENARDEAMARYVVGPCRAATRDSLKNATLSFVLDRRDVSEQSRSIPLPTLMVATDDRPDWRPADALAVTGEMTRGRTLALAGSKTLAAIEQPSALVRAIVEFWDSAEQAPGRVC